MDMSCNMKKCTKCGKLLPNTKEYFYEGGKRKDGTKPLKSRCKECEKLYHRIQDKKWYQENKHKKYEYQKLYIENNKEKIYEYQAKYRKTEKGKLRKFNEHAKRRVKEQSQGSRITKDQWLECMSFFDWKCAYSGEYIGGKQNYQRTIDHIIPLNKGGEHKIWNLVPMTRSLNSSKQDKDALEWYKQQDCYNEERLAKIYEWQEYARKKWKN